MIGEMSRTDADAEKKFSDLIDNVASIEQFINAGEEWFCELLELLLK